jgi:hypothetical protein
MMSKIAAVSKPGIDATKKVEWDGRTPVYSSKRALKFYLHCWS